MPWIQMECDCTFDAGGKGITFCPLHTAAPDLLTALEFAVARFCDAENVRVDPAAATLLRVGGDAIAKAKGGA